jgi:hypothetical protein
VAEGSLHAGVELFLFTDNFVAETIFFKGDARSEPLFEAALRLRKLEMEHGLFIHLVWVSGKRMIAQGTNGLSRGDLTTGVMKGDHMLDYVPLHLSVVERSLEQADWLLSVCLPLGPGERWTRLTESEWFDAPFWDDGNFLWTPPPCAVDVAVSLAAEAHHIRPWNTHVFLVPSIMAYKWRRQLGKAADLLVVLPFDAELWPADGQFERLTLAIICPLLRGPPWRVARSNLRGRVAYALQGVQEASLPFVGDRVREFWEDARRFPPMQSGVARSMLQPVGGGRIPHGFAESGRFGR